MSALTNKTIVIIGGTSGFGLNIAQQLLPYSPRLIITGRQESKLHNAVAQLKEQGANVSGYVFDAAQTGQAETLFSQIGPFDHLVSMAGGFMGGGFVEAPFDVIRQAVEEKLFNNLSIARAAKPYLQRGGSLVFTAGSGGKPHNASGAIVGNDAIRTLVQGLAVELAPHGRVNAVAPTWTPTPLWRHMAAEQISAMDLHFAGLIPLGRTAKVEEVASAYVFLLSNTFITGQTIAVDGGLTLM